MSGELFSNCQYIANLLSKEHVIKDTSPLTKINYTNSGSIHIDKLVFDIVNEEIFRNARPSIKTLRIILNIDYQENPDYNSSGLNGQIPFDSYGFSLSFSGMTDSSESQMAMHLDMEKSSSPNVLHPMFHLTFGGEKLKNIELGDMLCLPAPRIAFPPMDIILGIDFVLSNFLERKKYEDKIIINPHYSTPLRKAQEKYWKPYYVSIAHHWCGNKCIEYQKIPQNIITSYIPTLVNDKLCYTK